MKGFWQVVAVITLTVAIVALFQGDNETRQNFLLATAFAMICAAEAKNK